ncbi:sulfate permease [soil metagenome]
MLVPKLFTTLKGYSKDQFIKDLTAGVIVGIVALPLAIAFGIASGVSPEKGIFTAVAAGFIISAFGGSRVQIGGPTGAFIIIVFGIVQKYGLEGLAIATIMSGIILILMGTLKLGSLIKFIPLPIITGFTSGIALIIFITQLKDLFGIATPVPAEFLEKIPFYFQNLSSFNTQTLLVSAFTLLIILAFPKISSKITKKFSIKIPAPFAALLAGTLLVYFAGLQVDTIGSRFGSIPSGLPAPHFPDITYQKIYGLIGPAFTIALLSAIESLLSAVVADGMIGGRHRSNMELVANGAANIIAPIFGGIPATGAIARTVTNIKNGGRTPVAGIVHSLTLFLILLFFGKYAEMIPMSVLAVILVVVAYNMSEWREFKAQLKMPKSDVIVLLTTFFLTIIFDLTIAIEVGIVLSALLFMNRMVQVTNVGILKKELDDEPGADNGLGDFGEKNLDIPEGVIIYEVNGPFFFGAASKFKEASRIVNDDIKVMILRLRNVPAIDATGLSTIEDFYDDCKKTNSTLILSGIHAQPLFAAEKLGLIDKIGRNNICGDIDDALERAKVVMGIDLL